MTIDEAKLNELLDRLVTDPDGTGHVTVTPDVHLPPLGTWTIDPADSSVALTWRNLRLGTAAARLHCLGVIHLDELPPVGSIFFEQPSRLPVLTMALDPASVQTHDPDLDTRLRGSEVFDVLRHRWWTLRSESLEVLSSGIWRVMAALTAIGTAGPVELRLEVDSTASSSDWLVLRGWGLLDRRALGIGGPGSTFSSQIRLELAVRARRVEDPPTNLLTGVSRQQTCPPGARPGWR
jgi:polyisoprenoid-binding protein YceI